MARTSLYSLPVELHTMIMRHLLSSSRRYVESTNRLDLYYTPLSGPEPPVGLVQEWIEEDARSPSLFPYNAASAWSLWHAILTEIPECWTRVVFDVTKDPSPFLGAFAWSEGYYGIEVVVYNSSQVADVNKAVEAERISAISEALSHHVPRCKSIIFNSALSSSLPPPNVFFLQGAPYLRELILECYTDDIDVTEFQPTSGQWRQFDYFPSLENLSLTGFWFMYLVRHAHTESRWLQDLQLTEHARSSLKITDFTFQESGSYSLLKFVGYLAVSPAWRLIHLSGLSLSYTYDPSSKPSTTCCAILPPDLHFESVSKAFLSAFESMVEPSTETGRGYLIFENCEVPTEMYGLGSNYELVLDGIIDKDHKAGIRDTIDLCCTMDLIVANCPSFGDDDLRWLGTTQNYDEEDLETLFPVDKLASLMIVDCPKVSARGVIELLEKRREDALKGDNDESHDDAFRLTSIDVRGKGIGYLTEEEKETFRRLYKSFEICLTWTVEETDGRVCEFSSETSISEA